MDFKIVTEKLLTAFRDSGVRYALMGGYALGLWGIVRTTVDIDFIINREDLEKADKIMNDLGYECKHKSENVSQYISPLRIMGEVDFLHAFRKTSLEMIERAEEKEIFRGSLTIRVLRPEDLIGLKLQAMKNDPDREQSDRADIESLISLHRKKLSWPIIEEYFKLFDMKEIYNELRNKYNENL